MDLQVGNPFYLKIFKTLLCFSGDIIEKIIHTELRDYLIRGEWYRLNEEQIDKVIELIK